MYKYCKHNVWYWTFIYFSKPLHRIPSHQVRQEPHQASWCQPRIYPAAEILSAVSCQPVTTALHWKKYIRGHHPVVLSFLSAFVNWSAISCIRTSVRKGVVARPFASLHDQEESFFINSRTHTYMWIGDSQMGTVDGKGVQGPHDAAEGVAADQASRCERLWMAPHRSLSPVFWNWDEHSVFATKSAWLEVLLWSEDALGLLSVPPPCCARVFLLLWRHDWLNM